MSEVSSVPEIPTDRFYRGWRIVLALFLSTLALFGVSIYSFIVLAHPLGTEYGWSPAQTGAAVSAMWLAAPIALLSGPLIRRFDPWHIIYAGLAMQAIGFASLPFVSNLEALYLLRIMMGVGKVALITAIPVIVTRWFSRRFATAMAIIWAGGAAGGFLLAPATDALLQHFDWRSAAGLVAAGLLIFVLIIGLMARGPVSPATLGIAPDGLPPTSVGTRAASAAETSPPGWREALAQVDFRTAFPMMLAVVGIGMASIAILTQEQLVLEEAGISSAAAATFLGITAVGSLIGSASIGWLLDRRAALWSGLVVAGSLYAGVLAFAALPRDGGAGLALLASVSCGYAFGAGEVLWITLTKRQFGTAAFATTYGGWYFALQIGYAAGGGVAGWGFERFGSAGFLGLVALMYVPAALLSLSLRGAQREPVGED